MAIVFVILLYFQLHNTYFIMETRQAKQKRGERKRHGTADSETAILYSLNNNKAAMIKRKHVLRVNGSTFENKFQICLITI